MTPHQLLQSRPGARLFTHKPLTAIEMAQLLKRAGSLIGSQIGTGVEMKFKPVLSWGAGMQRVTYRWPGVVRVYCVATGELLAESEVGTPAVRHLRRHEDLPLTVERQSELLRAASALLESSTRTGIEARFCPRLFGMVRHYRVTHTWPGVLRVFDLLTGELLATSKPGTSAVQELGSCSIDSGSKETNSEGSQGVPAMTNEVARSHSLQASPRGAVVWAADAAPHDATPPTG